MLIARPLGEAGMPLYRKRPVTIEAIQWFKMGDHEKVVEVWQSDDAGTILAPLTVEAEATTELLGYHRAAAIYTSEGWMIVSPGDWIIKGVKGELYPCKPDIFALTYDSADEPTADAPVAAAARDLIATVKLIAEETSDNLADVVRKGRAFCDKMAEVEADSRWKSVWTTYAVHGLRYDGPFYEAELDALRAALRKVEWLGL